MRQLGYKEKKKLQMMPWDVPQTLEITFPIFFYETETCIYTLSSLNVLTD